MALKHGLKSDRMRELKVGQGVKGWKLNATIEHEGTWLWSFQTLCKNCLLSRKEYRPTSRGAFQTRTADQQHELPNALFLGISRQSIRAATFSLPRLKTLSALGWIILKIASVLQETLTRQAIVTQTFSKPKATSTKLGIGISLFNAGCDQSI